ncbi:MAG: branched-chain amino acid aminotransferase, partial [Rhodospirillaceae bacterium]|nr:branched-chain amino acid aminotransferase [Rhodospirillaceae bacterium]
GSRTVLDVLDAEQELLDSRVDLVVAQRDQIVAAYQLLQAIGRLTAEDLDLPVAIYDPTRNFRDVEDRLFGSDILDGN